MYQLHRPVPAVALYADSGRTPYTPEGCLVYAREILHGIATAEAVPAKSLYPGFSSDSDVDASCVAVGVDPASYPDSSPPDVSYEIRIPDALITVVWETRHSDDVEIAAAARAVEIRAVRQGRCSPWYPGDALSFRLQFRAPRT